MQKLTEKFDHVFIDQASVGSDLARRAMAIFPKTKISFVNQRPFLESSGELSSEEFNRSKRNIFITPFKGQFFKRCPGSRPGLACCNYYVLNWGLQCEMNCSYCYLQSFINTPVLTLYSNLDQAIEELFSLHKEVGQQSLRVGTGETVDSLSMDALTGHARTMIEVFREFPLWTLEFKTKSNCIENFLDVPHAGNVIVSWSINPQYIVEREEHGTASLEQRLRAAEQCLQRDFKIAFHIDPMIWHPEWKQSYGDLVDQICQRFKPEQMPYLSVGALRFQPEQRAIMRERFAMNSLVTQAEVFPSQDGKLRYDRSLRTEMFDFLMQRFHLHDSRWRIFMCMETPETWLQAKGQSPFKDKSLENLFSTSVTRSIEKALEQKSFSAD